MTALPAQPLSPLDGRYQAAVSPLGEYLSEAGLNRARVQVEVEWLLYLTVARDVRLPAADRRRRPSPSARSYLEFGQADIDWLAEKEAVTRHDVKAVEYLVRDRLASLGLDAIAELTHFACTSEDINNLAYALTVSAAVQEVWLPKLRTRHRQPPGPRRRAPGGCHARTHPRTARDPDHDGPRARRLRLASGAGRRSR